MKMRKFIQNKLWRDKGPVKLEKMGSIVHVQYFEDAEFDHALRLKLLEEADEVNVAKSVTELKSELADVFEVLDTLLALHNIDKAEIKEIQKKKYAERGGFAGRKFVTIAEHPEGSFGEKYCLAQPEKYPEVIE